MFLLKLAKLYFKRKSGSVSKAERRYRVNKTNTSSALTMLALVPYLLIIPIVVFHALSLTGCVSTSPAIPNIYLVKLLENTNATGEPLQVRFSYFGICGIDDDGTRCESATGRSVETLAADLFPDTFNASSSNNKTSALITDLVTTAVDLQSDTFVALLTAAAVLFPLGLAALVLLKRDVAKNAPWDRPRRSAAIRRATYAALMGSTALGFAAAFATTQTAGALEYVSAPDAAAHAAFRIEKGTTLQVLQWITFGFQALFALAVPFLVRGPAEGGEGAFKGEA